MMKKVIALVLIQFIINACGSSLTSTRTATIIPISLQDRSLITGKPCSAPWSALRITVPQEVD